MFYANMYNIDCPKCKHTLLVETRKCLDKFGDENSSATHDLENEVTKCCHPIRYRQPKCYSDQSELQIKIHKRPFGISIQFYFYNLFYFAKPLNFREQHNLHSVLLAISLFSSLGSTCDHLEYKQNVSVQLLVILIIVLQFSAT